MADSTPLRLACEARNLDALFAQGVEPSFPHTGRLVDARLAEYLQNLVREPWRVPTVELEISLREPPEAPSEEDAARHDLRVYFLEEKQVADLQLRVNQREGWGFLRRTFPLLIAAFVVAGILYAFESGFPGNTLGELVAALFYVLFITIVWVLLWDPIEMLLFTGYLLRARIRALQRLGEATVRFAYRSVPEGR